MAEALEYDPTNDLWNREAKIVGIKTRLSRKARFSKEHCIRTTRSAAYPVEVGLWLKKDLAFEGNRPMLRALQKPVRELLPLSEYLVNLET